MLLFIRAGINIILPLDKVFNIISKDSHISINYDSGTLFEMAEGSYEKKVETVTIYFKNEDEVNKIIRQFYKACNNNAGAFFVG